MSMPSEVLRPKVAAERALKAHPCGQRSSEQRAYDKQHRLAAYPVAELAPVEDGEELGEREHALHLESALLGGVLTMPA
jgi:hypothetical protein